MRKIQNANISFRVTNDLKERLTEFCLENDLHNSFVLRQALVSYLKGQRKAELPRLMVENQPSRSHLR
jgi:predicted transcriptional regulator